MVEEVAQIANLRTQLDKAAGEVAWFEAIPHGVSPGAEHDLREILENRGD
jgi:hypothetical protein